MEEQKSQAVVDIALIRLNHVPFVVIHKRKMAVWSDVKELLLWCPDPRCGVFLNVLKCLLGYPDSEMTLHPCSQLDQLLFLKHFMIVAHGTLLVDLDIIRDVCTFKLLQCMVKQKHAKSKDPNVVNCTRIRAMIVEKYVSTSFKIHVNDISSKTFLPALRRLATKTTNTVMSADDQNINEGWSKNRETCTRQGPVIEGIASYSGQKIVKAVIPDPVMRRSLDSSSILVPLALLARLYHGCDGFLNEAVRLYILGRCHERSLESICPCTVEEGIQLTRFLASSNGYDRSWLCLTSSSLMMSWSEFMLGLDRMSIGTICPDSIAVCVVPFSCQTAECRDTEKRLHGSREIVTTGRHIVDRRRTPSLSNITDIIKNVQSIKSRVPDECQTTYVEDVADCNYNKFNTPRDESKPVDIVQSENVEKTKPSRLGNKVVMDSNSKTDIDCRTEHIKNTKLDNVCQNDTQPSKKQSKSEAQDITVYEPKRIQRNAQPSPSLSNTTSIIKKIQSNKSSVPDECLTTYVEVVADCKYDKFNTPTDESKPSDIVQSDNVEKTKPSSRLGNKVVMDRNNKTDINCHTEYIQNTKLDNVCQNDTQPSKKQSKSEAQDITDYEPERSQRNKVEASNDKLVDAKSAKHNMPLSKSGSCVKTISFRKRRRTAKNVIATDKNGTETASSNSIKSTLRSLLKGKKKHSRGDSNDACKNDANNLAVINLVASTIGKTGSGDIKDVETKLDESQLVEIAVPNAERIEVPQRTYVSKSRCGEQANISKVKQKQAPTEQTKMLQTVLSVSDVQVSVTPKRKQDINQLDRPTDLLQNQTSEQQRIALKQLEFPVNSISTNPVGKLHEEIVSRKTTNVLSLVVAEGRNIRISDRPDRTKHLNSFDLLTEGNTMWQDREVNPSTCANLARNRPKVYTHMPTSIICSSHTMGYAQGSPNFKTAPCAVYSMDHSSPNLDKQHHMQESPKATCTPCTPLQYGGREFAHRHTNEGHYHSSAPSAVTAEGMHMQTSKQRVGSIAVQNYGSSSSTTPDIFDEFARKRKPKTYKAKSIQIKPKQVTKTVPTTLSLPILRKSAHQGLQRTARLISHTGGYVSGDKTTIPYQQRKDMSSTRPNMTQTYQYTESSESQSIPYSSQAESLNNSLPTNCISNPNFGASFSLCVSDCSKKIITNQTEYSGKADERRPFVSERYPITCEQQPIKSSSSQNHMPSASFKSGLTGNRSDVEHSNIPSNIESFQSLILMKEPDIRHIPKGIDHHSKTATFSMPNETEHKDPDGTANKSSLLLKVPSFIENYASPSKSESLDIVNSTILGTDQFQSLPMDKLCSSEHECSNGVQRASTDISGKDSRITGKTNGLARHENPNDNKRTINGFQCENTHFAQRPKPEPPKEQKWMQVYSQLYYKVPEYEKYHCVTGNMKIPPHAQFFVQTSNADTISCAKSVPNFGSNVCGTNVLLDKCSILKIQKSEEQADKEMGRENISSESPRNSLDEYKSREKESLSHTTFYSIIRASEEFIDKNIQMKHIINEPELAIQNANKYEVSDNLTSQAQVKLLTVADNPPTSAVTVESPRDIIGTPKKSFEEVVKINISLPSKNGCVDDQEYVKASDKARAEDRKLISRNKGDKQKNKQRVVSLDKHGNDQRIKRRAPRSNHKVVSRTGPKTSDGQRQKETDDCINNVILALRRFAIDKSKKSQELDSPKVEDRQRKLRSFVVNQVSSGMPTKTSNVKSYDQRSNMDFDLLPESDACVIMYNTDETDTEICLLKEKHDNKLHNDCDIALEHMENDTVDHQTIGTGQRHAQLVDEKITVAIQENIEDQKQVDYALHSKQEAELDEDTLITKSSTNELALYGIGNAQDLMSNADASDSQFSQESYLGIPCFIGANSNMTSKDYSSKKFNVETESTDTDYDQHTDQMYNRCNVTNRAINVTSNDHEVHLPIISATTSLRVQTEEQINCEAANQQINGTAMSEWTYWKQYVDRSNSSSSGDKLVSTDKVLHGLNCTNKDLLEGEVAGHVAENCFSSEWLTMPLEQFINVQGNPQDGYYFVTEDNQDSTVDSVEQPTEEANDHTFTYVEYGVTEALDHPPVHTDISLETLLRASGDNSNTWSAQSENQITQQLSLAFKKEIPQFNSVEQPNQFDWSQHIADTSNQQSNEFNDAFFSQVHTLESLTNCSELVEAYNTGYNIGNPSPSISEASTEVYGISEDLVNEDWDHCYQYDAIDDNYSNIHDKQHTEALESFNNVEGDVLSANTKCQFFPIETDLRQEVCVGDSDSADGNIVDLKFGVPDLQETDIFSNELHDVCNAERVDVSDEKDEHQNELELEALKMNQIKDESRQKKGWKNGTIDHFLESECPVTNDTHSCSVTEQTLQGKLKVEKKRGKQKRKWKITDNAESILSNLDCSTEERYSPSPSDVDSYFEELVKRTGMSKTKAGKRLGRKNKKERSEVNRKYHSDQDTSLESSLSDLKLDFDKQMAKVDNDSHDRNGKDEEIEKDWCQIENDVTEAVCDSCDVVYNPEDDLCELDDDTDEYNSDNGKNDEDVVYDNGGRTITSVSLEKKTNKRTTAIQPVENIWNTKVGISLENSIKKYNIISSSTIQKGKKNSGKLLKSLKINGTENLKVKNKSCSKNFQEREMSNFREFCLKNARMNNGRFEKQTVSDKDGALSNETKGSSIFEDSNKLLISPCLSAPDGKSDVLPQSSDSNCARVLRKKPKSKKPTEKTQIDKEELDLEVNKTKQMEESIAAEGFIKTQKLYFEILRKSSIGAGRPDKAESSEQSVEEIEPGQLEADVIDAIPVHGERVITRALNDAEKALEGTGSLKNVPANAKGTVIEDLVHQYRYQLIQDEDNVQLGGIAYFNNYSLAFVYFNGYKYTPLKDVLTIFTPNYCASSCTIPRNLLQKHKALVETCGSWDQVYKLALIKMKKGRAVMTGDKLVTLDSLLTQLPELILQIVERHRGTKLKGSKKCDMKGYNELKKLFV